MTKQWNNLPDKNYIAELVDIKDLKNEAVQGKIKLFCEGGVPGGGGDVQGVSVTVDPSTYVMTTQLTDVSGQSVGSPATVDLPLESMVVGGEYNDTTKSIILTLKNGQTVEFSVADLVSGLQTEITAANPLDANYIDDSNSNNKLVTNDEKVVVANVVTHMQDQPDDQIAYISGESEHVYICNQYGDNSLEIHFEKDGEATTPTGFTIVSGRGDSYNVRNGALSLIDTASYGFSPRTIWDMPSGWYSYDPNNGVVLYADLAQTEVIAQAGVLLVGITDFISPTNLALFFPTDGGEVIQYILDMNSQVVEEKPFGVEVVQTTGNSTEAVMSQDAVTVALGGKIDAVDSTTLPPSTTQSGVIITNDYTQIDPESVIVGQIVVDLLHTKVYVVSGFTTDPDTGDVAIEWAELTSNDAVLTIQNNGTTVGTFTANSDMDTTIDVEAPVITMTTSDPGEGVALAENHFIAVYSDDES